MRLQSVEQAKVRNMLRAQSERQLPYVIEGPSEAWPKANTLPKRVQETVTEVHSCAITKEEPCITYIVARSPEINGCLCICEGRRKVTQLTSNEAERVRTAVFLYILNVIPDKTESETLDDDPRNLRKPPLAVITRADDTQADESQKAEPTFPTTQAVRQKKQKQQRKQELLDKGYSEAEIKKMTRRRQIQEEHYDDCGSDTGPIEDDPNTTLLLSSMDVNDWMEACFRCEELDDQQLADQCEDLALEDKERHLRKGMELTYFLGSEAECHPCFYQKGAHYVPLHKMRTHIAKDIGSKVDMLELCGGQPEITRIANRQRLANGINVNLIT